MIEIHVTCKDENEARTISEKLITKKIIACASYHPIKSVFLWEKKVCEEQEFLLILKTTKEKEKKAISEIKRTHSYTLPVILTYNVKTTKDAEKWINSEISD